MKQCQKWLYWLLLLLLGIILVIFRIMLGLAAIHFIRLFYLFRNILLLVFLLLRLGQCPYTAISRQIWWGALVHVCDYARPLCSARK